MSAKKDNQKMELLVELQQLIESEIDEKDRGEM